MLPLAAASAASEAAAEPAPAAAALHRNVRAGFLHIARAAHGAVILHVAVNLVRHVVIDGHVVDLADRQCNAVDAGLHRVLRVVVGDDVHAAIVRDDDALAVGIHPDIVRVAAAPVDAAERFAAIGRLPEAAIGHQHLIRIGRRHGEADVIAGAADERALPVDDRPVFAAVIGAPDGALVGGLDEGVDPFRILRRDGDVDLADRRFGQAVALHAMPCCAGIVGDRDARAFAAAEHAPAVHHDFPGSRDQRVGVGGVHAEAGAAGIGVDEQRAGPGLAAVGGLENTALLLRAGEAAGGAHVDDIGIGGVHDDAADAAGFVEAHMGPGLAGVGRLVDAVAHHVAIADGPGFAGPGPDDVVIRARERERADGLHGLGIEYRDEAAAAIGRLPDAARRRAGIVNGGVAGDRHHGGDAVADGRSQKAEAQSFGRGSAASAAALSGSGDHEKQEGGSEGRGEAMNLSHSE